MALENLRKAYRNQKSEPEIRKIARGAFIRLAEFGIEWLRMPQMARQPERYLAVSHLERVHSALQKNRGVVFLVSHNGNWEIMALIAGLLIAKPLGVPIYALARPLKNPFLYHYILRLRGLTGLRSIARKGGARESFARLRENGILSLLIDQRIREGGIHVGFFGRKALTTSLPAVASRRLGSPVFYLSIRRTSELRFEMDIHGPIPVEMTENPRRDIQINTQRFLDQVETEIREDPSRWLWMHNRWRLKDGAK